MSEHQPQRRLLSLALGIRIGKRLVEAALGDAADEVYEMIVLGLTGDAQGDEIAVEHLVERDLRVGLVLNPGDPDAVADQQMIQRAMDRAEEGRARLHVLGLGQGGAGIVEPAIGPGVVTRQSEEIAFAHQPVSGRRPAPPLPPSLPWP